MNINRPTKTVVFLSTLSLRRATRLEFCDTAQHTYFYPRSPCGERQIPPHCFPTIKIFLSTLSLRRATNINSSVNTADKISIHALLAESDGIGLARMAPGAYFYPRSPCGERLAYPDVIICTNVISIHALLAESDSVRPHTRQRDAISIHALLAESDKPTAARNDKNNIFLSTLSLRRATNSPALLSNNQNISIHALLAESDTWARGSRITYVEFLSTLSLRRATIISQHSEPDSGNFYPRSPCGERRILAVQLGCRSSISIHALLAESDPY